jgi:hypothetical protein
MIILALVGGVGLVSGLVLHHFVQTLLLWVGVVLGFRRSPATGWVGLPLFLFWLVLMGFIWLQLLGITRFMTMHFSPLEIGMTIVVGIGSVLGIVMFWRLKSTLSSTSAGLCSSCSQQCNGYAFVPAFGPQLRFVSVPGLKVRRPAYGCAKPSGTSQIQCQPRRVLRSAFRCPC